VDDRGALPVKLGWLVAVVRPATAIAMPPPVPIEVDRLPFVDDRRVRLDIDGSRRDLGIADGRRFG
jgi:hypothetical protein